MEVINYDEHGYSHQQQLRLLEHKPGYKSIPSYLFSIGELRRNSQPKLGPKPIKCQSIDYWELDGTRFCESDRKCIMSFI